MISWAQLTTPPTVDTIFARLITFAKALKLPTQSWGPKNFLRAALSLFALVLGDQFGSVLADIAKGGLRSTAKGDWLDIVAREFYGIERIPADFAIGTAAIANGSGVPKTIAVGDLYITAVGDLLFRNITGGTVAPGGTLLLSWQAEHPGTTYNVGGESIVGLATPIAGLSVSVAPSEAWLSKLGVDEELDDALAERCGEQWSTIGTAGALDAYIANAIRASTLLGLSVTRARAYENAPTPGWVTMYLAGSSAPISTSDAAAVRQWFEDNAKRPGCVGLICTPAVARVIVLTGLVTVKAAQLGAAKAAIAEGLIAIASSTDFGGVVDVAEIVALVRTAPGVTRLALATPAVDVTLAPAEIATFADALTYASA